MHNFMGLSRIQKTVWGSFFAVLLCAGVFMFISNTVGTRSGPTGGQPVVEPLEYVIDERPTDFVKVGTITANNPGLRQDTLYLIYEEPGKPALKKAIVMDALSVCGAIPCMLMSLSFDVVFGGKRVTIEGIEDGEDAVILRKMTVIEEGQELRLNEPGSIFVPWPYVANLIRSCGVSSVMQTHSLDVYVTLKENGRKVRAVEPVIDEVFRVFEEVKDICPSIPLATE